ncbi:DUF3267 domain-containing protein [Anaerobacillus sp. MEB173]|uniref:DUF3267 domain-containing protein n=1 Tax=Anaerobacillus sp. MEB173 TaxID=3383345 RepID=UPI003F8DD028
MNCWKSIHISREYSTGRLIMIALTAMLAYFNIFYLSFSVLMTTELIEYGFLAFFVGILLIIPLHKLLHCIPIWLTRRKATLSIRIIRNCIPLVYYRIYGTIPRNLSILSVVAPAVTITGFCIIGTYFMPYYLHYFAIFSAVNIGLSVTDFIYLKQLIKAPKHSYVEDFSTGFHILLRRSA